MNDSPFHRDPPAWLEPGEDLPHITPVVIASDQIIDAIADLDRDPATFLRWPFPELDAVTGPMAPGNVWFLCAQSGGGKTTFVASIIDYWQAAGKKIYVMALETRPREFRTYLACMALGINPGDVLSGHLSSMPGWGSTRETLKTSLLGQMKQPYVERVMVSAQRAINLHGLQRGLQEAKAFGADVVIVDHIDHISGGEGKSLYTEAKEVNDGALRMAQDNDMLLLFTSQLNTSAVKGDYLAKFLPPKIDHVAFGSLKQRNATGMIGLFRPVRARRPNEPEEDFLAAIKAARAGTGDIADALEPNTMGVVAMKLRNYGSREGTKVFLGIKHGHVFPLEERDKWTTQGMYPRKVV